MAEYGTSIPMDEGPRAGLLDRLLEAERARQIHDAYMIAAFVGLLIAGWAIFSIRREIWLGLLSMLVSGQDAGRRARVAIAADIESVRRDRDQKSTKDQ